MMEEWHPKRVMDFFKCWYSEDLSIEDDTTCLADDLKEATDPLYATQLVIEVLSLKWTHCRGQNIGKISKIIESLYCHRKLGPLLKPRL